MSDQEQQQANGGGKRRRIMGAIFVVLFGGMMAARVILQRQADAEQRERMEAMQEFSRELNQSIADSAQARSQREMNSILEKNRQSLDSAMKRLKEIRVSLDSSRLNLESMKTRIVGTDSTAN